MKIFKDKNFTEQNSEVFPKVSIIILNWNGWKDTIECLESVFRINYPNYQVIVVDNGSTDDSVEKIREYCEGKLRVESEFFEYNLDNKPIKIIEYSRGELEREIKEEKSDDLPADRKLILIRNEKNIGFAGGCNIGIQYALRSRAKYIWLLNNDTVVDSDALMRLVKAAQRNSKIGFVGSKIFFYNNPNLIWSFGEYSFSIKSKFFKKYNNLHSSQLNEESLVNHLVGCSLLVRVDMINDIGMLDERYFMYGEEHDWEQRAKNAGWLLLAVSSSKVYHKISKGTRGNYYIRDYYRTRNSLYLIQKYSHFKFKLYISFLIRLLIGNILRGEYKSLPAIIRGICDFIRGVQGVGNIMLGKKE